MWPRAMGPSARALRALQARAPRGAFVCTHSTAALADARHAAHVLRALVAKNAGISHCKMMPAKAAAAAHTHMLIKWNAQRGRSTNVYPANQHWFILLTRGVKGRPQHPRSPVQKLPRRRDGLTCSHCRPLRARQPGRQDHGDECWDAITGRAAGQSGHHRASWATIIRALPSSSSGTPAAGPPQQREDSASACGRTAVLRSM